MGKNTNKAKIMRVPKEYAGEYIVRRSWGNSEILAHGKDPSKAYEDACKMGAKEPVLMFVRDPKMVCIY